MVYKWRSGRFRVPAQIVGETIERLGEDVTPQELVDVASHPDSMIHRAFEWDDTSAARKYRLAQASRMMRCLDVVEVHVEHLPGDDAHPREITIHRPAMLAVGNTVGASCYATTAVVMRDVALRNQVLADALGHFRGLRRRYAHLRELARIFRAIDALDQMELGDD